MRKLLEKKTDIEWLNVNEISSSQTMLSLVKNQNVCIKNVEEKH